MIRTMCILTFGFSVVLTPSIAEMGESTASSPSVVGDPEKERSWRIALSPDGKLLAAALASNMIKLWDANTKEARGTIKTAKHFLADRLAFSADGKKLAAAGSSNLWVYDIDSGKAIHDFSDLRLRECAGIGFLPDGNALIAAFRDTGVTLWNLETGKQEKEWKLKRKIELGSVMAMAPDRKTFALTDRRYANVVLFESATGKELFAFGDPKPPEAHPDDPPGRARGDPSKEPPKESPIRAMEFSFDGKLLACGRANGHVLVYDLVKRSEFAVVQYPRKGLTPAVCDIAFSRDNKLLTFVSEGNEVPVVDLAANKRVLSFGLDANWASGVAFSVDGKEIITCTNWKVKVWDFQALLKKDAAAVKPLMVLTPRFSSCVAYAPDKKSFAVAIGEGTIQTYDAATYEERTTISKPEEEKGFCVRRIAFSPDGKKLAAAAEPAKLWIFDVETGKPLFCLKEPAGVPVGLAFFPDSNTMLSAFSEDGVKLWDLGTQKEVPGWKLRAKVNLGEAVAVSPDGATLAVGCSDHRIALFNVSTGLGLGELDIPRDRGGVTSLLFSANGKLLAGGTHDGTAIVYEVSKRKPIFRIVRPTEIRDVAITSDNKLVAVAEKTGIVRIFDVATEKELLRLEASKAEALWVLFSNDDKVLITGALRDPGVCIWDLEKLLKDKLEK